MLNKSINLLIRTRIFENFNEVVRCSDCNAVVYEGLIPRQRFVEGLKMKQWECPQGDCKHHNTVEMSLTCKRCKNPRPRSTLPKDLVFPLYVPLDPMKESNRQVAIMEKLLQIVPVIDSNANLEEMLKEIKQKEKEKGTKNLDKDFDKINTIEKFLEMRANYIRKKQDIGTDSRQDEKESAAKFEDEYYASLVE